MTAFRAAFEKAGVDTSQARLAAIATNLLQRAHGNFGKALAQFSELIDGDFALRHAVALAYLQSRQEDMRGEGLRRDGHLSTASQPGRAVFTQKNEGDAGQMTSAQNASAPLPASPSPNTDGVGQNGCSSASYGLPSSSAPVRSLGGQSVRDDRQKLAPPASKPNPPRGIASIRLVQDTIAKSILDDFKVRDGRAIGDLHWHELTKMARTNEAEARILRYVEGHVANARPEAKVRDVVTAKVVQEAIDHAETVYAAA